MGGEPGAGPAHQLAADSLVPGRGFHRKPPEGVLLIAVIMQLGREQAYIAHQISRIVPGGHVQGCFVKGIKVVIDAALLQHEYFEPVGQNLIQRLGIQFLK